MNARQSRRRACCCLPVRIGVTLVSLAGTVVGLGFTTTGILAANKLDSQLSFIARLALQLHVFIYIFLTAFSIIGLVSAARRSRQTATLHFSSYAAHLPLSIASGIFLLYVIFSMEGAEVLNLCTQASGSSTAKGVFLTKDVCNQSVSLLRGASVTILIVVWVFQFYSCFVLNSYVKELAQMDYKVDEYVISP